MEIQQKIAECMAAEGFEYIPFVPSDVGGGFGPKAGLYAEEYATALAAIALKRPVKWIEDRVENLVLENQAMPQVGR